MKRTFGMINRFPPARLRACALCFWLLLWLTLPAYAQTEPITDDDVNVLANRLYCPVCPNETLDACRTEACAQWREDIRVQLQAGATEQQVIDTFVARFGQRVVGNPQDPALRALAVGAPILLAGSAVIVGVLTFARWRGRKGIETPTHAASSVDDPYRTQIERDLE